MSTANENKPGFFGRHFRRKDKGQVASAVSTPVSNDGTVTPMPNQIGDVKVSENNKASNWTGKLTFP